MSFNFYCIRYLLYIVSKHLCDCVNKICEKMKKGLLKAILMGVCLCVCMHVSVCVYVHACMDKGLVNRLAGMVVE